MIGSFSQTLSSNQVRSYAHNTSSDTCTLEQKSVQSLRTAFNHWIRSLPMEERFIAVKIEASTLPDTIRKVLFSLDTFPNNCVHENKHPKQEFSQKYSKGEEPKKFSSKLEKGFWESLVLVSEGKTFLDCICFDFGLLECPEKLFDLLMTTEDSSSSHPLEEAMRRRRSLEIVTDILKNCNSREQLAFEVMAFLKQEILLRFRESYIDPKFLSRQLEEQKKLKKQFSMHWKFMNEDSRIKMLFLGNNCIQILKLSLKQKGIEISCEQLEKQIQDLLNLQKNDFCNRIFKCKLKKSLNSIVKYYELVYYEWKRQVQKNRRKRMLKHMRPQRDYNSQQKKDNRQCKVAHGKRGKHQKHRKSTSVESNDTNETEHQRNLQKAPHSGYKNKTEEEIIMQEAEHKDMQRLQQNKNYHRATEEHSEGKIESKMQQKHDKKKGKIKHDIKKSHDYSVKNQTQKKQQLKVEKQIEHQDKTREYQVKFKKPTSISSSSTKFSSKSLSLQQQPSLESAISENQLNEANQLRLNDQLQDMSDHISQSANQFHERRVIAFERIQFLLQYYNIPIRLFGSCASGIAVKNSDIDIAIDNSLLSYMEFLPESERIRAGLEWLVEVFRSQPCISQIKFIKTAVIPVIKLTIDTSYPFLDPSIGQMYYVLNRGHFGGPIDADITVETRNQCDECSHLGIISTDAINSWLAEISSLHTIVIVMKQYFLKRKLNVTYEGGLNGFSMIVLFVAYIYHAKLQEEDNISIVLYKILKFYTEEFNEKQYGIDLMNHKKGANIFYLKDSNISSQIQLSPKSNKLQHADLQIHDPMQQRKNMTRNCYLFPQIKQLFKQILDTCFDKSQKQLLEFSQGKDMTSGGKQWWESAKQSFLNRNVFMQLLTSIEGVI